MSTREQLLQALAAVEKQRSALGDSAASTLVLELRAQLQALETPLPQAGERKNVTVMFADISGFTAMSEKTDPENMRALINATFERLVPYIERNGGTVEKFIGDEIMAIFGAPLAHENDAERAVRTALEMMEALVDFNHETGLDLGIHIGINTGPVIAGMLGTRRHQQYGVMGDTVNLASRLVDASERGQIFVGPDTQRLTAPLFVYRTLEPIRVKGKTQPVQAYHALGLKTRPGQTRGLEAQGIHSPLVGRIEPLTTLLRHIERVSQGHGSIVGVIAEAGLGKSRLVTEARAGALDSRARWLEGRSVSYGQAISYWPVRELIRQAAGITDDDDDEAAWGKLAASIRALLPDEADEILPLLASLLALSISKKFPGLQQLDSDGLIRQMAQSVRRALERMAAAQPLVLVLEDLHWADESSVTLLESILPLVRTVPLLVIVVTRPEFQSPGGRLLGWMMQEYRDNFTGLWLEPLSTGESIQLLNNLLTVDALPITVRDMILQRAEGNPFYVEEVIRALIALGAVVREPLSGRWQATSQAERVTIPETIQGIIMARVDRLEEHLKNVLRMAAVIGRTFPYRILRALDEGNHRLGQYLDELKELELVREKSRAPELVFIFKNAVTSEAIYESILIQERRILHARIGQAIERLAGERVEPFFSILAYHYARAEEWEKALEYLLKAGNQAQQMAADAEALAHYRRALEMYSNVQGARWNPLDRAQLELKMAEAYFRRGEHAQAMETLEDVLAATGGPLPAERGPVRVAVLREGASQALGRILPALKRRRPDWLTEQVMSLRGRSLELLAWIDTWNQPDRSALETLQLLNLAEVSQTPYWEQIGSAGAGYMFSLRGAHRLSQMYHSRSIRLAEKINQPASLASAYQMAASSALLAARWESCIENYRKAVRQFEKTGNLRGRGLSLIGMAIVRRSRGEFGLSMDLSRQNVHLGREGGDAQVLGWGLHGTGLIGWLTGSLPEQESIHLMEDALESYRSIPDYSGIVNVLGNLGAAYLRQGKLRKAVKILEDAVEMTVEKGVRSMNATPAYNGLALAYLYAAEREEDSAGREGWLHKARQALNLALRHGGIDQGGLAEAQRLMGRYEWLCGQKSSARAWWKRSVETSRRRTQPYESALTYIEMGERMRWREYLGQAEIMLQKIGAMPDLERVLRLQDELMARKTN